MHFNRNICNMDENSIKNTLDAETLALKVLHFVLADEVLQNRFVAISGMSPEHFKNAVHNNEFLGGVFDFLLGNEADVLRFCKEYQVDPNQLQIARRLLPGYTNVH